MSEDFVMPEGAPLFVEVGGILDGRTEDSSALRRQVQRLSECGLGVFKLDVTGFKFSILPRQTLVKGDGFTCEAQAQFLQCLQGVVSMARADTVESTLHSKLIYPELVVETLFVCGDGAVKPISRIRERLNDDYEETPAESAYQISRRDLLLGAALLLITGVLVLWRTGYLERLIVARESPVACDAGQFQRLLVVEAQREWGVYIVTVSRGPDFPDTPQRLSELVPRAVTLAEGAALSAVGGGATISVELLAVDGKVLESSSLSLAPLLQDDKAVLSVQIPARLSESRLRLSVGSSRLPR